MTINQEFKRKAYTRREYLEITRRQKPPVGYVPYDEALNHPWIESFCFFLRRLFGARDSR